MKSTIGAGEYIVKALNNAENTLAVLCAKDSNYIAKWLKKNIRRDLRQLTKARRLAEEMHL